MTKKIRLHTHTYVWIVIVLLNLFLSRFILLQTLLSMESNDLRAEHCFLVPNYKVEWCKEHLKIDSYLLKEIEHHPKRRVFAILALNNSSVQLPLSAGKNIDYTMGKEALIGKDIEFSLDQTAQLWDYGRYEIIGNLGRTNNSPLSNWILINDPLLFEEKIPGQVYLNSFSSYDFNEELTRITERKGISRWLNTYLFNQLFKSLGLITTVILSGIFSLNYFRQNRKRVQLQVILGIDRAKIILKVLLEFAIYTITPLVIMCISKLIALNKMDLVYSLLIYIVFFIIASSTYLLEFFKVRNWLYESV